jgi:heavy-metal-associated domain-containing protein
MTLHLAGEVRAWFTRPRIVHRLPGRLRLHVPALKHVDPAQRDWTLLWRDILGGLAGFRSVEVNLVTANVLIGYDSDQLPEQELIEFLEDVNRLVLRHWDHLVATPHDALPEALRRLVGANRARRPSLDHQTGISGDVAT